jgi:uncharacterized protein involved in cysteine biosynthesis
MQVAWKFGVVALVALAIVVLPGGGSALDAAVTLLTITFFAAIAFLGYRLFREHRFELDTLESGQRLVLYASAGLALVTFTATNRLYDIGGAGILIWLALLALCSYGIFWVWTKYRRYG